MTTTPATKPAPPRPDSAALAPLTGTRLPAIPDGSDAKIAMIDGILAAGQRLTLWLAVAVARLRDDYQEPAAWIALCTQRWGWTKGHVHHLRAVGAMLVREQHRSVTCHTLLQCDIPKLQALTRLPPHLLAPFLERVNAPALARDQVRAKVNNWLAGDGEPAEGPTKKRPPKKKAEQLDFVGALFAAADERPETFRARLAGAEVQPGSEHVIVTRCLTVTDELIGRMDPETEGDRLRAVALVLRQEADKADCRASGLDPKRALGA